MKLTNELSDGRIEERVLERKLLGDSNPDVNAWQSFLQGGHKRFGRIESGYVVFFDNGNKGARERPRPASHVEHALFRSDAGRGNQPISKASPVASDVTVVCLGGNGKGHWMRHASV
jgi:hypothetical protein